MSDKTNKFLLLFVLGATLYWDTVYILTLFKKRCYTTRRSQVLNPSAYRAAVFSFTGSQRFNVFPLDFPRVHQKLIFKLLLPTNNANNSNKTSCWQKLHMTQGGSIGIKP